MQINSYIYRFFYLICVLLSYTNCCSQVNYITTADGLSNRYISAIIQTKDGVMWIGTANGLNSYDGYNFTPYNTFTEGIHLSSSRINCLMEDSLGNIWVGTNAGLNKISEDRRKSILISGTENMGILTICSLGNNSILVGNNAGGIISIDAKGVKEVYHTPHNYPVHQLGEYGGNIWFCNESQ